MVAAAAICYACLKTYKLSSQRRIIFGCESDDTLNGRVGGQQSEFLKGTNS
jgi:hypothetical protein